MTHVTITPFVLLPDMLKGKSVIEEVMVDPCFTPCYEEFGHILRRTTEEVICDHGTQDVTLIRDIWIGWEKLYFLRETWHKNVLEHVIASCRHRLGQYFVDEYSPFLATCSQYDGFQCIETCLYTGNRLFCDCRTPLLEKLKRFFMVDQLREGLLCC